MYAFSRKAIPSAAPEKCRPKWPSAASAPKGRKKELHVATLSDLGVTKTQSSRWQRLADLPKDEFESKV
jgi:hypothetical protein